jgi:hypothetical protein
MREIRMQTYRKDHGPQTTDHVLPKLESKTRDDGRLWSVVSSLIAMNWAFTTFLLATTCHESFHAAYFWVS